MPQVTLENVDDCFRYHGPDDDQVARYAAINEAAKAFAKKVLEVCPGSREASLAITNIQQARMWANASIALEDVSSGGQ